jgi:hypothetical protein
LRKLPPLFFPVKTKYETITVMMMMMIIIIIIIIIIIKFTLVEATKFLRGRRGISILFL